MALRERAAVNQCLNVDSSRTVESSPKHVQLLVLEVILRAAHQSYHQTF